MALKILQLQNKLDIAHRSLSELEAKEADFETRAAELEARIPECRDAASQAECDEAIEKLDADKAEYEEAKANLQREIEGLEAELRELDKPIEEDKIETVEERKVEKPMEIRESREYLHAWVEAVKTGDERELRSILTENTETVSTAKIPVPAYVEGRVRTAWESDGFVSRIAKTFVKGNLSIMYESASSAAVVHEEGTAAPNEEALTLGKVELIPATIKKWVGISDERLSLTDESFVDYIVDELTYRIIKKFRNEAIVNISASTLVAKPTGATSIAQAILLGLGALSDEATNPVAIMSKTAWAQAKIDALNAGYAIDPFAGLEVLFNDSLHTPNNEGIIVADLRGYHANFPNGLDVKIVADEKAKEDMVEFVGKLLVGHGVVAPGMIALVMVGE